MMPTHRAVLCNRGLSAYAGVAVFFFLLNIPLSIRAQTSAPKKMSSTRGSKKGTVSQRVSLSPRFSPGQVFRYAMEFETTSSTRRSGLAADPQGPTSKVVTWNATIRLEVLAADSGAAGGTRLRVTYEKSAVTVRTDTFDPSAVETQEQYLKLEGKIVEFTLDPSGKVKSVSGLEGIVDGERGAQLARDWITHLDASSGAPPGGVLVGDTWKSEQPADTLPLAGLAWRTDSQYLRNEPCNPPNPDLPATPAAADPAATSGKMEPCAVILTNLNLVQPKRVRDSTPEEYRKNGIQTAGRWAGSGQSLVYVSLNTGAVVSVSQTGSQDMDITATNDQNVSLHYTGTVLSRSQVESISDEPLAK